MSDEQVEEIIVDSTTEEDGEPEASSGAMVRLLDEPPTLFTRLGAGVALVPFPGPIVPIILEAGERQISSRQRRPPPASS